MNPLLIMQMALRLLDLADRTWRLGRDTVTDEEIAEAFMRGHESDERMRELLRQIEARRDGGT